MTLNNLKITLLPRHFCWSQRQTRALGASADNGRLASRSQGEIEIFQDSEEHLVMKTNLKNHPALADRKRSLYPQGKVERMCSLLSFNLSNFWYRLTLHFILFDVDYGRTLKQSSQMCEQNWQNSYRCATVYRTATDFRMKLIMSLHELHRYTFLV